MLVPFLKKNGKYTVYDTVNNYLFGDNLPFPGGKEECIDYKKLPDFEFDYIHFYHEGFARAKKEGDWYFIDSNGHILKTQKSYTDIQDFEDGIAPVREMDYWAFINKNGVEISNGSKYYEYSRLDRGFIEINIVKSWDYNQDAGEKEPSDFACGLLDLSGFEIIKPKSMCLIKPYSKFVYQAPYSIKYFARSYGIKLHDYSGTPIFVDESQQFEFLDDFYNDRALAQVRSSKEYVIVDEKLKIVKNLGVRNNGDFGFGVSNREKPTSEYFLNGISLLRENDKWGFININGEYVLKPIFDELETFIGDYTVAGKKNGSVIKYGIIDLNFNEKTEFIFDEIKFNSNNIASVRLNNKFGVIDIDGKFIIPTIFSKIEINDNSIIEVSYGDYDNDNKYCGLYGFYNKSGIKITPIVYEYVGRFENGFCIVKKGGKYGIINDLGKQIFRTCFDNILDSIENYFLVEKDEKIYVIDSSGLSYLEN